MLQILLCCAAFLLTAGCASDVAAPVDKISGNNYKNGVVVANKESVTKTYSYPIENNNYENVAPKPLKNHAKNHNNNKYDDNYNDNKFSNSNNNSSDDTNYNLQHQSQQQHKMPKQAEQKPDTTINNSKKQQTQLRQTQEQSDVVNKQKSLDTAYNQENYNTVNNQPESLQPEPVPAESVQAEPVPAESQVETVHDTFDAGDMEAEAVDNTVVTKPETAKAAVVATTTSTTAAYGTWGWPLQGGKVISNFNSPTTKHKGLNIDGVVGTPILAASAGEVVYSGNALKDYGNLIIIKHSDQLMSAYAHINEIMVKEGDMVVLGQQIATMGSSGIKTKKPMLHFEVRLDGNTIDPMRVLPKRS